MIKRTITRAVTLILLLTLLSGCLLTRLHGTQKQVCSKKTRLEMTQDGFAIVFDKPLLTRKDIIAILGSEADDASREAALVYIARNKNDHAFSFPVSFSFAAGDQYKLTKVSAGKRFQDFLSEELLLKIFDAGCTAKRKGLGIEVDLSGVPVGNLPSLEVVKKLLGRPGLSSGTAAVYHYELNGTDTAEIAVTYDHEMKKMTSAAVSFQRYSLVFDFEKGVATAALKSLSDAMRLGIKP